MNQNEPQHTERERSDCSYRRQVQGCIKRSVPHRMVYTPARGFEIIAIMAEGYSVTAAAAAMGLHRDRITEWQKQHPEFADAVKRGKAVRVWKLETDMLRARKSAVVKARTFLLAHADPEEWADKDGGCLTEDPLETLRIQLIDSYSNISAPRR